MRHEPAENKYNITLTEARDGMDSKPIHPAIISATRELLKIANETPVDVPHPDVSQDTNGLFLLQLHTHIQNLTKEIETLKEKNKRLRKSVLRNSC